MTDYFKTIRAYLRGKWGLRGAPSIYVDRPWSPPEFPKDIDDAYALMRLSEEIARLRRNKKKHSHLQKQLDDLLNGGAQISDQQTETTK